MANRLFQAAPKTDLVHKDLGLTEDYWYFWDANFRQVNGGYKRMDQAEMHMRQLDAALRQCPTGGCED